MTDGKLRFYDKGKETLTSADGDKLRYYWSDETPDSKWDDPIPDGVDPWNLRGRS